MADDLDFSKPAGAPKPAAPATPQAPIYVPAIAQAFFESAGKEEQAAAGTVFFSENQKGGMFKRDKMYFLLEGQVGIFSGGKPLGTIRAGQIFGEMAAITESPRSATAAAHTPCRVISLDDKGFNAALQKKPEFALMMLGTLITRLRGMIAKLSGIPTTDTKESRVFDKKLLASLQAGLGGQATVRYERGKIIMVAGQAGALMYVVLEGTVGIQIRGAVIERVGPGGVFGEMALVDQSPRSANAVAETDCGLLAINRNVFLSLVKSDPTFGIALLGATAERVRNTAAGLG
jgi:CRP/FNR family transcriptional regulator, cyclic AMP receptor protein